MTYRHDADQGAGCFLATVLAVVLFALFVGVGLLVIAAVVDLAELAGA